MQGIASSQGYSEPQAGVVRMVQFPWRWYPTATDPSWCPNGMEWPAPGGTESRLRHGARDPRRRRARVPDPKVALPGNEVEMTK